ncbi:rhodanese-like domain-containing protein [Desulfosoma caldarium]|uniref:Rhodanese-related sulfurtransferase n=1 Tax=Desulfosoma caldarium TaxID=610254 RepID=A0A3N1UXV9_9BACT|nr:rhodanese-like domain-containing protein [Desulfosoma caldarium]ROQ92096.1 rhodanese-related sulfurtransferase [Desulfosoma caldarium]
MKKKLFILSIVFLAGVVGIGLAHASGQYNYISAEDLNARLAAGSPMIIVDICPAEQYAKGHIKGAIETNAYPVKTEAEKARLAELLPKIQSSTEDIIIVCPRGGGGAKKTVDFYKSKGVEESRLLILEKGMDAWPYETEKK